MTSFLGTSEAYSYSKQGTGVICRSDLTTSLREAGVKSGFGLGRLADVATTEQK